eukprot:PhF_6_TR22393/c0_g1_i1/m.31776
MFQFLPHFVQNAITCGAITTAIDSFMQMSDHGLCCCQSRKRVHDPHTGETFVPPATWNTFELDGVRIARVATMSSALAPIITSVGQVISMPGMWVPTVASAGATLLMVAPVPIVLFSAGASLYSRDVLAYSKIAVISVLGTTVLSAPLMGLATGHGFMSWWSLFPETAVASGGFALASVATMVHVNVTGRRRRRLNRDGSELSTYFGYTAAATLAMFSLFPTPAVLYGIPHYTALGIHLGSIIPYHLIVTPPEGALDYIVVGVFASAVYVAAPIALIVRQANIGYILMVEGVMLVGTSAFMKPNVAEVEEMDPYTPLLIEAPKRASSSSTSKGRKTGSNKDTI